ncbi:MAG: prepilin peptidase [Armatimonadota bacterium]|nr:prepilin peptidase [Armatimonadota bacterium]
MLPAASVLFGFFFGAAFGSFLNVVIYRFPRGMSLAHPPSHCPKCDHRLGGLDLFPLLSFLLAGAKCRYCKAPIGWRYFFVELLMGVVWAALWWQFLVAGNDPARFIALAGFATALVAALFIDLEHFIIPDSINAIILLVGVLYNAWLITQGAGWFDFAGVRLPSALAGWIVGTVVMWAISFGGRLFLGRDAMGHGDIKLARGIGAVLFPVAALISFGLSIVIGLIIGVISIYFARRAQPEESDEEDGYDEEPESLGGLSKAGLGYLMLVDVWALFAPKLEEKWFGPAYQSEEAEAEDDWKPGNTTIPFGPALAIAAIVTVLFEGQLLGFGQMYLDWALRR